MMTDEKKTSALPILMLVVLIIAGIGVAGFYSYSFYAKKKMEKELRIVEEQKKAEIEEVVTRLLAEATVLSDEKKQEEALTKVDEALRQNPNHDDAMKLRSKVNTAIDLEQLIPVKKLAEIRWGSARTLSPGQGFESSVSNAGMMFAESERLYGIKDYRSAKTNYQAVAAECEKLLGVDAERLLARGLREESDKAQDSAKQAKAEEEARQMWTDAREKDKEATSCYENGEFGKASDLWKVTVQTFTDAAVFASGTLAVRAVEKNYNDVLETAHAGLLDTFGGQKWAQTKTVAGAGRQLAGDQKWVESVAAWTDAAEALRDTVKTALIEEARDRMQKKFKVAMTGANDLLAECQKARKTDKNKIQALQAAIVSLDLIRAAADYGLLAGEDHTALDACQTALNREKFCFRFPDLVQVDNPVEVSVTGLAAGSGEALAAQRKTVVDMDAVVEVKTRKTGIALRLVPAGSFTMGRSLNDDGDRDELPSHTVVLKRPFYMAACEVTQSQWEKISGSANPSSFGGEGRGSLPVENVSFDKAAAFCELLCAEEGAPRGTYRLPTEAEWEYACRAGTATAFVTGDNRIELMSVAWMKDDSQKKTHPVGQKAPNAFGLYDMHGNVWEWCSDGARTFTNGMATDPAGPTDGFTMVTRGGAWNDDADFCRSANRGWARKRNLRSYDLGLRVIRVLPPEIVEK